MLLLLRSSASISPGPQIADVLRMASIRMRLAEDQQVSGLGGGRILVADLGPKYWEFEVSIINLENRDSRKLQAMIETLDGGMGSFYLGDPRAAYPISDPDGTILGASVVQIASLNPNNREMTLAGLLSGFMLTPGDMLHFDFGSPVKRAYHRIVVGGAANGGGVSPSIEVRPHILPGAIVGAVVTLIRPMARVKIVPGSFDPGTGRGIMTSGMSFKCRQVF